MGCSELASGAADPQSPEEESGAASRGSPRCPCPRSPSPRCPCPRSPSSLPVSAASSRSASSLSARSWDGAGACGQAGTGRCPRSQLGAAATADFWACAIPAVPPPRRDRRCPRWDPHRHYEELLDFAYPLRPPPPPLHDSGIDVGSLPASPARTWGSAEEPGESFVASTPVRRKWGRRAAASRCEPPAAAEAPWAESASLAAAPVEPGWLHRPTAPGSGAADTPRPRGMGSSARRLLPAALPQSRECDGDDDDEFLSLPPRLGQLQSLARYLSGLGVSGRPPARHRRSAPSGGDGERPCSVLSNGDSGAPWSDADEEAQPREGLAQSVKAFCCQLQELIRWLRDVADAADRWRPPARGAWSGVESARRYVAFRQDVAEHRALARSVLRRGDALLECLAASSPALKDALELVARQSAELERHAEQLHAAVLTPAPVPARRGEAAAARLGPALPSHALDA